jgi:predicted transcriptional regulator
MNSNLLKGEAVAKGFTLKELSDKAEIKIITLYRKLRGLGEFNRAEIERIINVLDLTDEKTMEIFFN